MAIRTACVIPVSNVPDDLEVFRKKNIHHPGSDFPLHTTLIPEFFDYEDFTAEVKARLRKLANEFEPFEYSALPLCSFPTTRVLWLCPSPQTPFEKITKSLCLEFPEFRCGNTYPIFHMTIAYQYEEGESESLAKSFIEQFQSYLPFCFVANQLQIYGEFDTTWKHIQTLPFGKR